MADGYESLAIDSALIFSHPKLEDLVIRSGAHSINWSYDLNTNVIPTVGGEVVQVLSCFVGPMTIVGEAAGMQADRDPTLPTGWGSYTPTQEMERIIGWFVKYMEIAGTIHGQQERRNETAITFKYPARGWDFLIQPTQLDGFDLSWDQTTLPWSITAEVVSDKALDYFVASTMNTYTDSLVNRKLLQQAISPGYNQLSNPFINPSFSNTDDYAKQIGNNFQALIAAWATGDFMTWGYNPIGGNENLPSDPYDLYGSTYGGWYIGAKQEFSDWSAEFSNIVEGSSTTPGSDLTTTAAAWITDVLEGLGAPVNNQNVCFLEKWQLEEGGHTKNTAKFNWLNTTVEMPGSSSAGTSQATIQKYPDFATGVKATIKTLKSGDSGRGYPNIVSGLVAGTVLDASGWPGIIEDLTTWGTGAKEARIRSNAILCVKQKEALALQSGAVGSVQEAMLQFMIKAEANSANWKYDLGGTGGRSIFDVNPSSPNPIYSDCSGYVTLVFDYASRQTGIDIPVPSAQSDEVFAGITRNKGTYAVKNVTNGTYQVGDCAVYGSGQKGHVHICKKTGTNATAKWSSFGSEPLKEVSTNYRNDLKGVVRFLPDNAVTKPSSRQEPANYTPTAADKADLANLQKSLHEAYLEGRSRGFKSGGVYNSTSADKARGGRSDHTYIPSRAFDLFINPKVGWDNLPARKMFNWLIRQPSVGYVILGDKVWYRDRGVIEDSDAQQRAEHQNHIHVSGLPLGFKK